MDITRSDIVTGIDVLQEKAAGAQEAEQLRVHFTNEALDVKRARLTVYEAVLHKPMRVPLMNREQWMAGWSDDKMLGYIRRAVEILWEDPRLHG